MITVLSGGVGAARYLAGQLTVVPAEQVTAVVNVADDVNVHGLHVSPDIDTVIYTLSGAIDRERGWGLDNESWNALTALRAHGLDAWFNLGDRDLGTHLFRTTLLQQGCTLSEVTARLAAAHGLNCRVLPVSDDRVETRVTLARDVVVGAGDSITRHMSGDEIRFQEYFVRLRHDVPVSAVRFDGVEDATAAPGVLEAIAEADTVVIAPSNPVVSIGPILAVPQITEALTERREHNVAISPIVDGRAIKGPADRLMRELGHEASAAGVARMYRDVVGTLVIDERDAALAPSVNAIGVRAVVAATIMSSAAAAADLARCVMDSVER